ncbi:MAG: glutaminyl-peptide cyclotransferase [Chromatiales bacterium]|jgi:glutaminyl-peptide cyclotransferase
MPNKSLLLRFGLVVLVVLPVTFFWHETRQPPSNRFDYEVVNVYPHDAQAFTQGLLYRDGFLYESTGVKGESSLRKVKLETGEILQQQRIAADYFAEGLTDWSDKLVQLTWKAGKVFVYDMHSLQPLETFSVSGEGWGLTRLDNQLVMSDGTSVLRFLHPQTFVETGHVNVTEAGRPVENLNELETVQGNILANVWQSNEVVIIDPATGEVAGRIDLGGLLSVWERLRGEAGVLNGIAYDPVNDRLFVTGKNWPHVFEIRLCARKPWLSYLID